MNDPELGDESHGTLPELAGRVSGVVHVFPVAIGRYTNFPDLDAEAQAGRLLDLLAPFGARHHEWAAPTLERGAGAVERRLREWAEAGGAADTPNNTVLYWVGHGWSDGTHA